MKSQLRPPAPGKGLQAPGKDLVTDQATPLPNSHSASTKSGTTEIGQGRRKDRKEPKPGESHRPLGSGQVMRQKAKTAKEKKKAKEKEKKKASRIKESRAKEKVRQARWEVARHPRPHHANDLLQPWWTQATATILRMSRTTRAKQYGRGRYPVKGKGQDPVGAEPCLRSRGTGQKARPGTKSGSSPSRSSW